MALLASACMEATADFGALAVLREAAANDGARPTAAAEALGPPGSRLIRVAADLGRG